MFAVLVVASGCGASEPPVQDEQVERGEALYAQHCQACHGDAATGADRTGLAPSHGQSGHTWHHADGQIIDIVLGRSTYPGRTMPSFEGQLSEQDVMDVLAYIKSGWTAAQRQYQADVSRTWAEEHQH